MFVIALSIPLVATIVSRWVMELGERTADPAADPGGLGTALTTCMIAYTVALWTAHDPVRGQAVGQDLVGPARDELRRLRRRSAGSVAPASAR